MIKIKSSHHADDGFVRIAWDVTEFCEKRCHYCTSYKFLKSLKAKDTVFDIPPERLAIDDTVAKLIPQLMTKGDVCFYGGEPSLHPKGIQYFNQMCIDSHEETNLLFVSHGDIDEAKIRSINPGNKKNYMVCVSYHFYQVKIDEWLEKVKLFKECIPNFYVTGLIPPQEKVWTQYRENVQKIMDTGVRFELKPQLDPITGEPNTGVIQEFQDLLDIIEYGINLDDGNTKIKVPNAKFTPQIPLIAGKSICKTRQFNLIAGNFERACGVGEAIQIDANTTVEEVKHFIDNTAIMCPRQACTDSSNITTNIAVMGTDLTEAKFAEYAACEFTEVL
jgi:organic radical activating enzyme